MRVTWRTLTPRHLPGAVAIVELAAARPSELDAALNDLGLGEIEVETAPLRNIAGIDTGLVARWAPTVCHLMIHGGPAVVRALCDHLMRLGLSQSSEPARFVEANNMMEQRLLMSLAHAASPLAVDLLLDQPRRWRESVENPDTPSPRDIRLRRLIQPPFVVALGPPNVGKSSLLNALADRPVAAVADEPGTTRDHVGATIDLAGLVVRYIDTPGLRNNADVVESQAIESLRALLPAADLLLLCADSTACVEAWEPPSGAPQICVGLRSDLGPACCRVDVSVSIHHSETLSVLVRRIREHLVPTADLLDPAPWVFWDPASGERST